MRIAVVCSAHGFGHVTRQLVIADALVARGAAVTIFSAAPPEIVGARPHVPWVADVGIAQRDSLTEDLDATRARLAEVVTDARIDALAARLGDFDGAVVDIAPPALEAARRARVAAVAVGNFDWAWIYRHYSALADWAARYADWQAPHPALALTPGPGLFGFTVVETFGVVGRVTTDRPRLARPDGTAGPGVPTGRGALREAGPPLTPGRCGRAPGAGAVALARGCRARACESRHRASLRRLRRPPQENPGEKYVLVCFGGFGLEGIDAWLPRLAGVRWVLAPPMAPVDRPDVDYVSDVPFPALVATADALLTKPGYGIHAEAALAGTPIVWVDRGDFPEAPHLEAALWARGDRKVEGRGLDAVAAAVSARLADPRPEPVASGAHAQVAARILDRLRV